MFCRWRDNHDALSSKHKGAYDLHVLNVNFNPARNIRLDGEGPHRVRPPKKDVKLEDRKIVTIFRNVHDAFAD